VIDEGPGIIDPEAIFKRYAREHEQVSGFGLGLTIVKEICDRHGVIIEIKPNTPTGSRFGYLFMRA
jgi:K+-sensing histidine kinase KdpD